MYVCVCKGVTDKRIRQAVDQGCSSLRQLRAELGVASQCGQCGRCARSVMDQHLQQTASTELLHSRQAAVDMVRCLMPAESKFA